MIDIATWQRQMNTLKQVPISVARILLRNGQDAISRAISTASANKLPGDTTRNNVLWKLRWHEEQLGRFSNPHEMYASGDDLKKWVLAAFLEANATQEGASWVASKWSQMWSEIGAAIAALPVTLAAKVNETAGALFGIPGWAVGVSVLGVLAFAGYSVAKGLEKKVGG